MINRKDDRIIGIVILAILSGRGCFWRSVRLRGLLTGQRIALAGFCLFWVGLLGAPAGAQTNDRENYLRQDIEKILVRDIDIDPCSQCHKSEFQVWKKTPHATGFNELHKKAAAQRIVKKMGFSLIKRESLCLKCHYTPNRKSDKLIAVAGVSCESCHGPAREWEPLHSDFGIRGSAAFGEKKAQESAEHRRLRLDATEKAGMLRPGGIYDVVANCFECHTVPHEKLVNVGGHSTGTTNFHLPEKIGKIRHNFLQSFLFADGKENAKIPAPRKRLLYITGRALDLEFSLRGAAEATITGEYFENMINRIGDAVYELQAIIDRQSIPEIAAMIRTYKAVNVSLNNNSALLSAANTIQASAKQLLKKHDGKTFSSIDSLMNGLPDKVSRQQKARLEIAHSSSGKTSAVSGGGPKGKENPYPLKRKLRPETIFATIGPQGCNCHESQVDWLKENFHNTSLAPFNALDEKVLRIATNYGVPVENLTRGSTICMDCHSTVITGKEFREVRTAVSCESCHGPGKDYKKPHQDKDRGYEISAELGMKQLEDAEVRAANCAECHYITDQRLLASGHPSGEGFDFVDGNRRVRHWEAPELSASALKSAFAKVRASRGKVPEVNFVNLYSPGKAQEITRIRKARARKLNAIRRKISPWPSHAFTIKLSEFPEIAPDASVEEILLILKQRLEEIYEKSNRRK